MHMSPELSQRLTAAVDGMPAFPKSVQRILELTRDVNSTPKDLVDVIDKDPVVTVKILKVVNSAYYSLPKQITSIGHAVVYLGFNTIKNLALSIAAIGMLPKDNPSGFDVQQYLLHSLATAGLAKQLAHDAVVAMGAPQPQVKLRITKQYMPNARDDTGLLQATLVAEAIGRPNAAA